MAGDEATKHQTAADERKARLAAELRANLQRRKAQARSRRAGEADSRVDGLGRETGDTRQD
ncbi:MAG: hypothetical protein JNL61_14780 [Rhizobiaceae bacterium]|nr:hypothetical protein [Rhizobiaceae bacterium]